MAEEPKHGTFFWLLTVWKVLIWANSVLTFLSFLTINVLFPLFLSPYSFLCLSFSLQWNTCCLIIQVVSEFSHFFRHQLFPYAHSLLYGFVFSDVVSFVICVCVNKNGFSVSYNIVQCWALHYITHYTLHHSFAMNHLDHQASDVSNPTTTSSSEMKSRRRPKQYAQNVPSRTKNEANKLQAPSNKC